MIKLRVISVCMCFVCLGTCSSSFGQICYKAVEKNCPDQDPVTCASEGCNFTPTAEDCSAVVNGILQGTYTCPLGTKENRIIFMSATPDCTSVDDDGTYSSRNPSITTDCLEDRFCQLECTATTETDYTGHFGQVGGPNYCTYTVVKAHCKTDSEGDWTKVTGAVTFTAIPCLEEGGGCPLNGGEPCGSY